MKHLHARLQFIKWFPEKKNGFTVVRSVGDKSAFQCLAVLLRR